MNQHIPSEGDRHSREIQSYLLPYASQELQETVVLLSHAKPKSMIRLKESLWRHTLVWKVWDEQGTLRNFSSEGLFKIFSTSFERVVIHGWKSTSEFVKINPKAESNSSAYNAVVRYTVSGAAYIPWDPVNRSTCASGLPSVKFRCSFIVVFGVFGTNVGWRFDNRIKQPMCNQPEFVVREVTFPMVFQERHSREGNRGEMSPATQTSVKRRTTSDDGQRCAGWKSTTFQSRGSWGPCSGTPRLLPISPLHAHLF